MRRRILTFWGMSTAILKGQEFLRSLKMPLTGSKRESLRPVHNYVTAYGVPAYVFRREINNLFL
jgi:hypothetical protein